MNNFLNVAAFMKDSLVVGPGVRDSLWVQGCTILCRGCGNQAFLPHQPRRMLAVETMLKHFRHRQGVIDGISVLGGEPTEQAEGVAALLEGVQALGFSTVVFTGRLYEELLADPDPAIQRLLAATDLLIDGPFILSERDPTLRWRGSRNQRLLYLTPRLQGQLPDEYAPATEIIMQKNQITVNGVAHVKLRPLSKPLSQSLTPS